MQGLNPCVCGIFVFCQPQQIVCRHAVEPCQSHDGKGAYILEILRLIFAEGGFGRKREKYKTEHDSEIRQFYAVKRKLDNAGLPDKKLTLKQRQAELEMLMEQYAAETAELKPVYTDLKKLRDIQFKVDSVLHDQQRQKQQRKQEVEH